MAGYLVLIQLVSAGYGWLFDNLSPLLANLGNPLGLRLFAAASGGLMPGRNSVVSGRRGPVRGGTKGGSGQQKGSYEGETTHQKNKGCVLG